MTTAPSDASGLAFLSGGGEMGSLVRAFDWSRTPLGPAETWPTTLRVMVSLVMRSPVPMVVLWGEQGIMIYNDGYSVFSKDRHPTLLGSEVRSAWPEASDFNDNVMKVVLAGGTLTYKDQELSLNRTGTPEPVWLDLDYTPIIDENGEAAGVFAVVVETTERVLAERRLLAERERLTQLFSQAPGFMAMLGGSDHIFELVNPAYEQLIGHRKLVGKPVHEALPEVVGQGFMDLLDQVYKSGQAFRGTSVQVSLQRTPDAPAETRYVDFVYQPILGGNGNVTGIFVEGYDVTERVRGEEHLRLLMNELNHRLKNTLATVRAIIRQTLPDDGLMKTARDALSARVAALSRAQDVLTTTNWHGADLVQVVKAAVNPYSGDDSAQFTLQGPSVALGPRAALSLSLALHELATNAVKYGALSTSEGKVEIIWSVVQTPEPQLHLVWRELGGPAVALPSHKGFGTDLIERGLTMELEAKVAFDYRPEGLTFDFWAALDALDERTEMIPA